MIRVVASGAAGRMGQAVCEAVEGAEDMELTAKADPSLGVELAGVLGAFSAGWLTDRVFGTRRAPVISRRETLALMREEPVNEVGTISATASL